MHVIGHHAPSLKQVAFDVVMLERVHHYLSAPLFTEQGAAEMTVENVISLLLAYWHGVVEPKDNMLAQVVAIVVRKVSALVPASCAHVGSI